MRRKLARILTAFVLVLCVGFGLTACKKNDDTANTIPKVKSISIELVNDSYELSSDTITVTYGGGVFSAF